MEDSTLARMANQIAAYFAPYPKPEAIDGILKHIHNFWEPRMRNQLKDYLDRGGEGLSPLFVEAAHEYFKGPKGARGKTTNVGQTATGASPAGTVSTSPGAVKAKGPGKRAANVGASPSSTRGT